MSAVYLNPVHPRACPDPFVLKYCGEYWCYCTGVRSDGRCFGILHSRDLIHWQESNGALEPLPGNHTCYWAPEVSYNNSRFYMYYSVGNETHMHIRVAVAQHPAGPFVDSGRRLTLEEFAIDAHVFVDEDGSRYLFYATDFLQHTHIGTGTVYDRLLDPFTLAREPRPVTRARYDWQVYDPQRKEKGGVRWHTVEGPFVLKHRSRYYQMFSGGNWQNTTYGVSYATIEKLDQSQTEVESEWEQACDGERVLPILRTLPAEGVIGPGHNSVVRGPDNRQLFCVYHRWSTEINDRVLALDRLEWVGEQMLVLGPSTQPQPAPNPPTFAGFGKETAWEYRGGQWVVKDETGNEVIQEMPGASAEARLSLASQAFVFELNLAAHITGESGSLGFSLDTDHGSVLQFLLTPNQQSIEVTIGSEQHTFRLPEDFEPGAYHLVRCEVNYHFARLVFDDTLFLWEGRLPASPIALRLLTQVRTARFAGFELTAGGEDNFTQPTTDPTDLGWQRLDADSQWRIEAQQLWQKEPNAPEAILVKENPLEAYEAVINVRLQPETSAEGHYGFYPALDNDQRGPLLTVERGANGWALISRTSSGKPDRLMPLPKDFDPYTHQHFRFRKQAGRLTCYWKAERLGEISTLPPGPTRVGLYTHQAIATFDLVRITQLPNRLDRK
jgi:GH43 family beta-xylosidase